MIGFRNGREADASFALQSFFLLDNQVIQVFRLKYWLIILRVVMYEVCGRIYSQVVRNQPGNHWPTIFLKIAASQKRASMSTCWTLGLDPCSCKDVWASFGL